MMIEISTTSHLPALDHHSDKDLLGLHGIATKIIELRMFQKPVYHEIQILDRRPGLNPSLPFLLQAQYSHVTLTRLAVTSIIPKYNKQSNSATFSRNCNMFTEEKARGL